MDLVYQTGTRRCREPAETLAMILPLLGPAGITRLADITGLDELGIPVAQAIRPLAATVSVSQGKGATLDAAMAGAAMEALELHHAEDMIPDPVFTGPATSLELGYEVTSLDLGPGNLVTERTVLDWIQARGVITGSPVLVPRDLVWLGKRTAGDWRFGMIEATSNGLAAGNSWAEATAHALYELAERDAGAALAAVPLTGAGTWTWTVFPPDGARNWSPRSAPPGRGWKWRTLPVASGCPVSPPTCGPRISARR